MNDAAAPPSRRDRLREMRVITLAGLLALMGLAFAAPAHAFTYTVTNGDQSGPGSLAAAVTQADTDASPPVIIDFAPGIQQIILTGTLNITNSMSIVGPGASQLEIDGNNSGQIFSIASSNTVSISGLNLAYARGGEFGGAVYNNGTLTMSDVDFTHDASLWVRSAIRRPPPEVAGRQWGSDRDAGAWSREPGCRSGRFFERLPGNRRARRGPSAGSRLRRRRL